VKIWRWAGPAIAAIGVLSGLIAPAHAASQSGYTITIGATGRAAGAVKGKVDGYALVIYRVTSQDTGTISGTVSGAAAGDVVTLLVKPFGARAFRSTGQRRTLSAAGRSSFTFSVRPSLATAYRARISTGSAVDATSASATIYVTYTGYPTSSSRRCTATTCTISYTFHSTLPPSAYRTETRKHVYQYLAQWKTGHPAKWFYRTHAASATKPKRISAGVYAETVTWHISRKAGSRWQTGLCTRDTESRDGMGLPGHHGCGAKRATRAQIFGYLG
jgi:hypothetical protein